MSSKPKASGGSTSGAAENRLSAAWVLAAAPAPTPYRLRRRLYMQVGTDRRWCFFRFYNGKAHDIGLGSSFRPLDAGMAHADRLRECARWLKGVLERANDLDQQIASGIDPAAERKRAKTPEPAPAKAVTFGEAWQSYVAAHKAAWKSAVHLHQWEQNLSAFCGALTNLPVGSVTTDVVLAVLRPIWTTKNATASKLRNRIELVLDFSRVSGWCGGLDQANPARWRGHLQLLLAKPSKLAPVTHHPALPWQEVPRFLRRLRVQPGTAALALRFVILTAVRTGEALGATWAEIDIERATWTIPAARMKAGREFRGPLSDEVLGLVEVIRELHDPAHGDWLFASPAHGMRKPLSNMGMLVLLKRMNYSNITVHGFRSTFRDWVAEATSHPRELAEAALAHALESKVEAAYQRGDLLEKRRALMADWAAFCTGMPLAKK